MKKKVYLNFYLLFVATASFVLFFSGCQKDDFLNQQNPNQQTNESFWKTLDDADQGLVAVYNKFKDNNIIANTENNNWSDITFPGFGNRTTTTNELWLGAITNASTFPKGLWTSLYTGIFRANQVILGMKTVTYTSSVADQNRAKYIKGQAYFFRGLFYFYLYNTFNKGSVLIKDENNLYDIYCRLSPAVDVRGFYLKDLDSAYSLLPDNWRGSPSNLGRVTKGAAASVLGQSYLYENNYDSAATYFLDVMTNKNYGNSNGYSLVSNIADNFNLVGEFNDESILEATYSKNFLQDQTGGSDNGVASNLARSLPSTSAGGTRQIIPSCWLELAFREDVFDSSDARNKFSDGKYRNYNYRLSKSIATPQDSSSIAYGVKQPLIFSYGSTETSYFKKFTNCETPGVSGEDKLLSQSGINFRVIRLADIYLMYAECLLKGGTDEASVAEALKYVNRVRRRSALQLLGSNGIGEYPTARYDNLNYTASQLMDFIKNKERPMELCIEGFCMRHIDMRRWGGIKDRFTLLSQQKYAADRFRPLDVNGVIIKGGYKTFLVRYLPTMTLPSFTEFGQVASVYTPGSYDYFPIPSVEETANPLLYK